MALYLNPDLDGPQETRGVCPLRLLEQTCSNVGRLADAPSRPSGDQLAAEKALRPAKRACSPAREAPEKRQRRDSPARESPPMQSESANRYTCQWMGCGLHFGSVQELSRHLHVHVQAQARDASGSVQLLTALPTPRASSSSSLSPNSTASVSPPTSPLPKASLQSQSPTIANSAWLASWLVQYLASAGAALPSANVNQPACNYAQAALTGSVNNYMNGLTSPTAAPRELTGYPVLSPFACGYPNGFSLLTSRFGNAV